MNSQKLTHVLTNTVERLADPKSLKGLCRQHHDGYPLPSGTELEEIISLSRAILFPGYFGKAQINLKTLKFQIGVNIERLRVILCNQILAGLCSEQDCHPSDKEQGALITDDDFRKKQEKAEMLTIQLIERLPEIRNLLATDVAATYDGDPAANNYSEIISCYPVIKTLTNYRIAHQLVRLGVPLIPRIIMEMAHSETGIDIHPAAEIGKYFTIDHGTGVVIGETCIIGDNVKIYQGVTLGAKSFPLDKDGNPLKGIPRHPIIENNVIIYANATVLGRITIGEGCVVGANTWVMEDMAPQTKKYNSIK